MVLAVELLVANTLAAVTEPEAVVLIEVAPETAPAHFVKFCSFEMHV